ncbi:MAG: S9 family peptidase [Proteobacteria bacterium]|nr:S9 family peptidase [Pseudomonadota bacterium]
MRSASRHLYWGIAMAICAVPRLNAASPTDEARVIGRALSLAPPELLKLVRGERLVPTWREKGSQFWFVADRVGAVDYLRVDPESKHVTKLFERSKLEGALHKVAVATLPDELPGFAFDFAEDEISFDHAGGRWCYLPRNDRLTKCDKVEGGLSPDKHWRVRVRDYNLYLEDTSTGKERQLTTDGSAEQPYARPVVNLKEMVAQGTSVPHLDADIVWSPDSRRFATYHMNLQGARRLSVVQSTPPEGAAPRVFDYVYPMTGDEHVPTAQTVIVDAASAAIVRTDSPPREMLYYGGPVLEWTRDSAAVLQEIPGRGYGSLTLYSIDAATGKSTVLTREQSNRFVDFYSHRWSYIEGADAVAWVSDTDGWNHAYLVDRNGERHQATSGNWTVAELAGSDKSGRHLFVVGRGRESGRDPYLRSLYSVGGSTLTLTPEPLDHDVFVSPDGRFFVDNQSLVNQPTVTVLRNTRDGKVLMKLQSADIGELKRRNLVLPEPFTVTAADGRTPLYGVLYKPSTFDPNKRYPVVEYIYTGPTTITSPQSFTAGLRVESAFAVAELGYIVVVVDARGTSGRGRAFLDPAYKNLHAVGLDDHIAAIKTLSRRHPYMDATAVGVYGFSAGGYDVVRAMTERPDFYKVGISASGNQDNRLDKAIWNEQWMGYPLGPQYDANSNVSWAGKLEGRLFLAYGELDENVPPAATLRLVDALIGAGKSFELLVVPNADHFLASGSYFNRRRFEFLRRNLPPPAS